VAMCRLFLFVCGCLGGAAVAAMPVMRRVAALSGDQA
jgi:hypothetical protein